MEGSPKVKNRESIESDLNRHHAKHDDPLWDEEESEKKKTSIRLKLLKARPKEGEDFIWNLMVNNKVVLVINGKYFSKKQIDFMLSVEGAQYVLSEYKGGCDSVNKLKEKIKEKIKNENIKQE